MKLTKALRYTLFFALIGIITTVLVYYIEREIVKTYNNNLALIGLGDNVKLRSAVIHKTIVPDRSLNISTEIIQPFTSVETLLQAAYDGSETTLGTFEKSKDEEARALLKESIIEVENLINVAKENQTGSFGATDIQKFESSYLKLQQTLDNLNTLIRKNINSDTSYLNTLSWISITFVLISFAFLCFWFYKLQKRSDSFVTVTNSKLEEETSRVGTLSKFIEAVSAGNFDIELESKADDNLTNTLVTMRDNLKKNTEDDRKRNWATTGLAQIGEILRAANTTTTELYDNIIKFVVKYTKSNQGGLFIINDENENQKHLDLVACYAFERKKYLERKVDLGQGLVGQCYLEGERIYLLEVPHDYVSITSGLGGTNPNALLIIPMKINDKVYGVIELASFNKYEEYEIELVEKLAESIASTISNVRVNETTRILLEKTQQQAEEMKSQEEEIRQNMEELEATQEEMRRKQTILEQELAQSQEQARALQLQEKKLTESQDTLQAIVDNIPRAIFWKDRELRFMGCNRIFSGIAGAASPRELIGKSDFDMAWSAQADAYRKDDMEVMRKREGKLDIEEVNINSEGEESWVLTSKVPIINENDEVVAILGMFEDITIRKRKEADINKKLQEREEALKELKALKQLLDAGKA